MLELGASGRRRLAAARERTLEAGGDGALPEIIMSADPEDGMRYWQEYYEGEDNGEALSTTEQAETPYGHSPARC